MTATISALFAHFRVSASRLRLAVLACLLCAPVLSRAQVIIANLGDPGDECIPNPDEGIFCESDPGGGFEAFWVFTHIISGDTTERWYVELTTGSNSDGNQLGHSSLFYDYTLTEGSRLTIVGSGDMLYYGTIQGAGALRLVSGYSLTFDPTNQYRYTRIHPPYTSYHSRNTYSGGTDIDGGWLRIHDDASLGTGALTLRNGGRLDLLAAGSFRGFTLSGDATLLFSNFDTTIAGVISGDGRLNKSGTGTLTLTAENTYTGGTHVAEGTLAVSADANLGAADTRVSLASGTTLALGDAFASSQRELALEGTAANVSVATGSATWNGATAGSGQLVKQGAGTLVLAGGVGHTGGADIAAGTLEVAVSSALGGTGTATWSGPITGSGTLVKSGAGTLTLSGAASHTGYTILRAGTLKTAAANVLSPSSALFLNNGSTLDLAGHDQTVGDFDSYNLATSAFDASTVHLGGATLTNLNRVTNNWHGSLTGAGVFVKQGSSAMNWYGANTFAGTLRIDAGSVVAQAASTLSPNATVTLASGATLQLNSHAQAIAGLSGAGNVALGSATLTLNQAADTVFSGVMSGSGPLIKTGAGTLTLSGANTYAGPTTVSAGTLRAGAAGAFGASAAHTVAANATLDLNGFDQTFSALAGVGNIALGSAALTLNPSADGVFGGAISGSGTLTKTGLRSLTLSGANTFGGATTVSAGTLRAGAANAFSASSVHTVAADATLDLAGYDQTVAGLTGAGTVALGSATLRVAQAADHAFSGLLSGSGSLTKTGSGTLTLSGVNTYQGVTTIAAGVLQAGAANTFSAGSRHALNTGATLALNNLDQTIAGLSGAGTVQLGSGTLTTHQSGDSMFGGAITGTGRLVKSGAGALTLSSGNAYSGGTTLNGGTLVAGHASALGSGTVRVNGGALNLGNHAVGNALDVRGGTLTGLANYTGTQTISTAMRYTGVVGGAVTVARGGVLTTSAATFTGRITAIDGGLVGGTGTIGGLTLGQGSTLAPGASPGTLTVAGDVTWDGGANYRWEINDASGTAGVGYDLLSISGALQLNATTANPFVVSLVSLRPDNTAGALLNFNSAVNSAYTIATTSGGILGFDTNAFSVDASGFANASVGGTWRVALTNGNRDLSLTYTSGASAIPEPSTYAALCGAGVLGLAFWRRRARR